MNKEGKEADTDNEDDAENDNNASLLLCPILALHDGGDCPRGDDSLVDSRHFRDDFRSAIEL